MRLNFRHNRTTQKFNGTVNFIFEEESEAMMLFNHIDGKDFNNFILRPEWIPERKF
jgi:hypothetical protein